MSSLSNRFKNIFKNTFNAIEKPHLKQRVILMVLFTLVILSFAVLFMPKTSFSYYNIPNGDKVSDEIVAGSDVFQPFKTGDTRVKSLLINFETYDRKNNSVYNIELLDENKNKLTDAAGNVVAPLSLNAILIENGEPYGIPLNMYNLMPNTRYYLHIYSDEATRGNAVGLRVTDSGDTAEEMLLGNEPTGTTIDMMMGYNRWSQNIICISVVICILVSVAFLFLSPANEARNTLTMVLILGIMFALITPIMNTPDEPYHVGTAFALAEGNFLKTIEQQVAYTSGFNLLNNGYAEIGYNPSQYVDLTLMPNFLNNQFDSISVPTDAITTNWGAAKFFLGYLPQTLGLVLSRLLGASLASYYYAGRIFNVIVYSICAYFAVKMTPRFKLWFSIVSLLPMGLFIAGSYNPDGVTYGLALLTVAKFTDMFFNDGKRIGLKDILIMAVFTALLCMNKYTLGLMATLTFFIPVKRFENRRLKWLGALFILVVSFLAAFAVMKWENYAGGGTSSLSHDYINTRGANATIQLNFILNNPATALTIFSNSIMNNIGDEMLNLFALGGMREYSLFEILSIAYFCFLAVVAFSYARYQTQDIKNVTVPVQSRILIFGVIIVTILLTYLALYLTWTPLYLDTIQGVQSRYFVGLFALIPFLGQNIWPVVSKDALIRNRYNCMFIAVLIASLTLMTTVVRYY